MVSKNSETLSSTTTSEMPTQILIVMKFNADGKPSGTCEAPPKAACYWGAYKVRSFDHQKILEKVLTFCCNSGPENRGRWVLWKRWGTVALSFCFLINTDKLIEFYVGDIYY